MNPENNIPWRPSPTELERTQVDMAMMLPSRLLKQSRQLLEMHRRGLALDLGSEVNPPESPEAFRLPRNARYLADEPNGGFRVICVNNRHEYANDLRAAQEAYRTSDRSRAAETAARIIPAEYDITSQEFRDEIMRQTASEPLQVVTAFYILRFLEQEKAEDLVGLLRERTAPGGVHIGQELIIEKGETDPNDQARADPWFDESSLLHLYSHAGWTLEVPSVEWVETNVGPRLSVSFIAINGEV